MLNPAFAFKRFAGTSYDNSRVDFSGKTTVKPVAASASAIGDHNVALQMRHAQIQKELATFETDLADISGWIPRKIKVQVKLGYLVVCTSIYICQVPELLGNWTLLS